MAADQQIKILIAGLRIIINQGPTIIIGIAGKAMVLEVLEIT
jgi:hypothetical protein